MMRRAGFAILFPLVLAVPCMGEDSELAGILKRTLKALSPYRLEVAVGPRLAATVRPSVRRP